VPDTERDRDLLRRTAAALHSVDMHALDATLAAPPPPTSRRVVLDGLPLLDLSDDPSAELRLGEVLGTGGMGVVESAEQRVLSRAVAVKRLRPELAGSASALAILLDEAVLTGSLEHPNVVPVYALGRDAAGQPAMVMKQLSGVSWRALLFDPDHPLVTAREGDQLSFHLNVLRQVCNALHYAHSRGVVHRDVKPENVMVGEYGEVYLVDWGAALVASGALGSEAIVGTLAYMAPEMLRGGGPHITARTDVYLLGATLHELLTGSPPHMCDDLDAVLAHIHRSDEPRYAPTVPAELAEICRRSMRKEPGDRHSSALAFRAALDDYIEHRGSYELAGVATGRLRQLLAACGAPAEADGAEVSRMFIECSFGYRQALEIWHKNDEARAGLQEATETMLQFEIARQNLDGAEALLEQLLEAREDLRAAVVALRDVRRREDRELRRLRDDERERDPSAGSGARALSAVITGVVLCAIFVALSRAYPMAAGLSHRTLALVTLSLGVALAGGALVMKEQLLATRLNRYLSAAIFAIVTGCLLVHVTGDLAGAPTGYGLIVDLLVAGTVVATVGINLHGGLVAVGAVYLAGAVIAAALPALVLEAMAGVFLVSHLIVAWTWRSIQTAS
jgi:serine/threonine-protein kinase